MTQSTEAPIVMPSFDLSGRVALVTGASSGLGEHFAWILAQAGAHVVVAARRLDRLHALVARLQEQGLKATAAQLDVTLAQSVADCFAGVAKSPGVPDIVVSNAGVTVAKPAMNQTEQDWDDVIDANLKGCWLVDTEAARQMVAAGKRGSIINIASILGARVAAAVGPYAISKAGVIQATKALALEWARHGIRVNALLPGYVHTPLNAGFLDSPAGEKLRSRVPERTFCTLDELGGPLLLLASDAGRAMTGATVEVDHGHLVSGL